MRDRRVAVRHALVHTCKLKQSLTLTSSLEAKAVGELEKGAKPGLEEQLDTVIVYVDALWQAVNTSLGVMTLEAEHLLEALRVTERDQTFLNGTQRRRNSRCWKVDGK